MSFLIGALVGSVWGFLAALLNSRLMKNAVKKNTTKAVMGSNVLRTFIDIVALGVVFLLRNILPFSFVACIVGTAGAMSITSIVFTFRLMKE